LAIFYTLPLKEKLPLMATARGNLNLLLCRAQWQGKCINYGGLPVPVHFGVGRCDWETDMQEEIHRNFLPFRRFW